MEAGGPSFAVVIPAYEAAATIGEALASLRAQTLAPAEVLVCDDGSDDDIEAALQPFDGFARLLRAEHRGVSAARNDLLRAARADFVVPLDADDVYASTRLQRLAELAGKHPHADILGTDATFVSAGRVVGRFGERTPFTSTDQEAAILDRCFVICPAMRRERLLEIGGYDEKLATAEDWDVCIRLILSGSVAVTVDEPLLEYRLGSESLTSGRVRTLNERAYMLDKAAGLPELSPSIREVARQAAARQRGRALEEAAREAVDAGTADARRRLLALARSDAVPMRARVGAAAGAIAPRFLRRLIDVTVAGSSGRPSR